MSKPKRKPKPKSELVPCQLPVDGYVAAATVRAFLGNVCEWTLWDMVRRGAFPPPDLLLSRRYRRWHVDTLRRYEQNPHGPFTTARRSTAKAQRDRARVTA